MSNANAWRIAGAFVGGAAIGVMGAMGVRAVVDAIAKANTPRPIEPWSESYYRADLELYRGLVALAQDASKPSALRAKARLGAAAYKRNWLDPGHAGYSIDPSLRRKAYGNWCGANCGSGEPVDEIDELCRLHDIARRPGLA